MDLVRESNRTHMLGALRAAEAAAEPIGNYAYDVRLQLLVVNDWADGASSLWLSSAPLTVTRSC